MNKIDNRLEAIYNALLINNENVNSGLLGGTLGEFLFINEYNKVCLNLVDSNFTHNLLEKVLNYYSDNVFSYNLNYGIVGLGLIIKYLEKDNQKEGYLTNLNEDILNIVKPYYLNNYKNIDLDYMNGIPGIIIYLIENDSNDLIELYIDNLIKENYLEESGGKWSLNSLLNKDDKAINIGLSHGIISHLYIFLKIYEKGFINEKVLSLISKLWSFLQKVKVIPNCSDESYFGTIVKENDKTVNSRLAWCYGDLSIGYLLLKTSISIDNAEMKEVALNVLLFSTNRKTIKDTKIIDAGICHGSAGVAYIYRKVYEITNIITFKECYEFWIKYTIDGFSFNDGIGGYKFYIPDKELRFNWINNLSFLEGASGVGLVVMNYKYNNTSNWDQLLMLD
ncbi:lanthionine synthetase C family protein [Spirosoma sp. RP8]|uniref:Lanthionine synthetase C family protein n=1 Tax=Spirosoma liriopis TaxID=2937440 RepID=A0ABT0HV65_9BACT|nr:lanthionine synthetase C family protein [Spirosoma liriopis]MCK8496080.1 lanthionine synthetase C family protein [Spirosoma liriopis]